MPCHAIVVNSVTFPLLPFPTLQTRKGVAVGPWCVNLLSKELNLEKLQSRLQRAGGGHAKPLGL